METELAKSASHQAEGDETRQGPSDLWLLWEHARANLSEEPAQRAFVEACLARRDLAFAAKCYRQALTDAEAIGDQEAQHEARVQLEKLQGLAWTLLRSSAKPLPQLKRITTWVAAGVCFLLLCAVAIAFRG